MDCRNRIRETKIQRAAEGYLELGMPQHALDTLARLGDPSGFDGHALYLWGEALRGMERYHEALVPLMQAAQLAPQDIHVWFALAWCYKRTGRIDLAISSLERVLAVEPSEALVHYNLACYWSLAGNKDRALEFLSQALEIDPDYRRLIDDEPDFDPIRCDPQFQTLCAESGAAP
ncbi:MAG: TPR end-of-group domain-containing protein [Planctomycetota bacterium]